jgi:ethanolamine utilization microcompartment shell protein EutL
MPRVSLPALAAAGVLLLGGPAVADVKSGIDVGQSVKAFNPQHVTGPDAGKSSCLV